MRREINVKTIARWLKQRQENDYDAIIFLTGPRGTGKSTLGIKIAQACGGYNMNRDLVFSREDVMKGLATKKKGIVHADEMINVSHNRDFYNQDQKKLIKGLNMYRDAGNILIGCVPNFYDLDKQIRSLVKFRIDVIRRGLGVIHMPLDSQYKTDKWDSKFNEKVEADALARNKHYGAYSKLTTFRGFVKFGDIGTKQKEKYLKIKEERRGHSFEEGLIEEKSPYDLVYGKVKQGIITKDNLFIVAQTMNVTLQALEKALYGRAKNEGMTYRNLWITTSEGGSNIISKVGNHDNEPSKDLNVPKYD